MVSLPTFFKTKNFNTTSFPGFYPTFAGKTLSSAKEC